MGNIIIYLCLLKALSRPAPSPVPRSGKEGLAMNCYLCGIILPNNSILWAESVNREFVRGYTIDGETEEKIYQDLPLCMIRSSQLYIKKFKGIYDYSFRNGLNFIIKDITYYIDFKIFIVRRIHNFNQKPFNKHPLQSKKRTEILKILLEQYASRNSEFNVVSLMVHIHSSKYFNHPDKDAATSLLKLYLESFVESGEIIKTQGINYKLTGKAIVTLEAYENAEEKHAENIRLQKVITFATIVIMFLAAIQADLIKMPIIIDLTGWWKS
ncbi:hypothetical protein [Aeromonas rivuli]|uniref:hypothetical protein n=1 Tax=Aeromonas rivuli TaxID=648794 RepID=UPI001CCDB9F9|nr:hypothetical protein [Aeromonas rivuli]UBO73991.1 hypothetical protein KYK33_19795 [Aeromonas rivuli]